MCEIMKEGKRERERCHLTVASITQEVPSYVCAAAFHGAEHFRRSSEGESA